MRSSGCVIFCVGTVSTRKTARHSRRPTFRPTSLRHRYWTGPPDAGQPATPLGPGLAGIVQAQRRHLRLLRRYGTAATGNIGGIR
jgi:hypothetical protein